ncbi:MAG: M23 family metallopeptidase [Bacteroidales bacterium]|jgi:murein DD-endopeptidase MepM/ murein hydrolase activator NlpD|nr:M23 family metallopeptidase [Bacteroidales bacterium]
MAKVKYRYNPETLSYDRVTTTTGERMTKWGIMFVASIVISVIYYVIYSHIYDTPKEHSLTGKLATLKFNYQMLSQELDHVDQALSDIQKRDDNIYRTVLESGPIPASKRQAGFGGVNRYESLEGYVNSDLMIDVTKHSDKILKQLYIQSLSYDELIVKVKNKEQMAICRPAIQPVSNKELKYAASGYGWRMHPIWGVLKFHEGLDFAAPVGADIYATGDGKVIQTGYSGGYGKMVLIDHGFGYQTLYAHMNSIGVLEGSEVKRGQVIGTVGNTGDSTGPHLHYEVHKNGQHVNPIDYFHNELSPEEYVRLSEQSQKNDIFEKW